MVLELDFGRVSEFPAMAVCVRSIVCRGASVGRVVGESERV